MEVMAIAVLMSMPVDEPVQSEAEEQTSRCIMVKPVCMPGTHPICICESDYSLNCSWVCAS